MSQRFFALILILIVVIFVLLKIVIPMWNFMLRADLAISLYDMLKNLLNDNFQCKKQTEIQLGVYTIRYSNTLEAYEELENTFTTLDGYSLTVEAEDNHLDLKNQEYDLPFYFGYASEYRGNMFIQSFSDFPSFHKHLQEVKRKNEISEISECRHLIRRENLSEYKYLISGKFKSRKGFSVTKIIPISFEMDDIEGNIITDKANYKFKVIGTASF